MPMPAAAAAGAYANLARLTDPAAGLGKAVGATGGSDFTAVLKQALNAGDHVPLTLMLEVGGKYVEVNTQAEVKALELSYQHYNDPTVKDHQ